MRAILRSIVFGCYLLATVGLYVHVHYCCGTLADVGLFGAGAQGCCGSHDAPEELPGCCQTEDFYFALDEEHRPVAKLVFAVFNHTASATPVFVPPTELSFDQGAFSVAVKPVPPEPLYLLFQRPLTYG